MNFTRKNLIDVVSIVIYSIIIILFAIFVEEVYILTIGAISIFIIDKILLPKRNELIKKESVKIKKQKIFKLLTELSKLCIERRKEKDPQEIERDTKIYSIINRIWKFEQTLTEMNIAFEKTKRNSTYYHTIVIEDKLHIDANVDPANSRVWYATIYLTGKHKENPSEDKLISEIYPILEDIRKKNNNRWDKELKNYFDQN